MDLQSVMVAGALRISLAALLSSPARADDDVLVLAPAGEWQYREFEDRCRASREFGEGDNRTTLWIEQGGLEPNYNLTLIGRPLRNPSGGGVHVRFGEEPEFIRSYITAKSSEGRPVLAMYGVKINRQTPVRDEDASEASSEFDLGRSDTVTSLALRTSIVQPIRFELGSMFEPLGALGLCGAKLSGILSNAGRALTGEASPPVPIGSDEWLQLRDYPSYLQRAEMGGELTVRLTVNRKGRANSCFVVISDRQQLFDDAVCLGLMKRALFEPALDVNGDPVASYFFFTVTFKPDD